MSVFVTPLALTDDGSQHKPVEPGRLLDPALLPVAPDKANLLECGEEGLVLLGESLISGQKPNALVLGVDNKLLVESVAQVAQDDKILSVVDNALKSSLSMRLDSGANNLELLGTGNQVVAVVKLPVVPGLPIDARIDEFTPPGMPAGTYLYLQFKLSDGELKDVYYDVSKLVDIYTAGDGIDVTDNKISAVVDPDDKVLQVGGAGLGATLGLAVDEDKNELSLTGVNGETIAAVEIPAKIDPDDKVLQVGNAGLGAVLGLAVDEDKNELSLTGKDGETIAAVEIPARIDPELVGRWDKRYEGQLPDDPDAVAELVSDVPVGGLVYATVGRTDEDVFLTPAEAESKYVSLTEGQIVSGVKTFSSSPQVPTAAPGDKSDKAASTAFVAEALTHVVADDANSVKLTGDQLISGTKTFADVPMVPTAADGDSSQKAANTAFVQAAVANAQVRDVVHLAGDETVAGVKTFTDAPLVPTQSPDNNSQKAANTAFVQSVKWGKRVTGAAPEGDELLSLLEGTPVGAFVYATLGQTESAQAFMTKGEGDAAYVSLIGVQSIAGVKTFASSPIVPTVARTDNSTKAASTAFVQSVVASYDMSAASVVQLTGDQLVTGVKTFTDSPRVPTPATGDNSTKPATTAFVAEAIAAIDVDEKNDVKLAGAQTITGEKTFSVSPVVPTAAVGDSSGKAASTAFVQALLEIGKWVKVVKSLPADATALVADMSVGGVVIVAE